MRNDAEVAHAVAASLDVDLAVVEASILEHHGDLETAMEVRAHMPAQSCNDTSGGGCIMRIGARQGSAICYP